MARMMSDAISLSSASDPDEFYDAEDSTPIRNVRSSSGGDDGSVDFQIADTEIPKPELSPLEVFDHEEKRLLDALKEAEERRKQEDEDILRKLDNIKTKRKEEHEKQVTAERMEENIERLKKLADMRQMMASEGSPDRPPPKPPRMAMFDHAGEEIDMVEDGAERDVLTSPLDAHAPSCGDGTSPLTLEHASHQEEICDNEANDIIATSRITDTDDYKPPDVSLVGKHIIPEQQNITHTVEEVHSSTLERNIDFNNLGCDKVSGKEVPVLLRIEGMGDEPLVRMETIRRDKPQISPERPMSLIDPPMMMPEPDIIQSTKSLPRNTAPPVPPSPPPPVAPPRRKKKNKAPQIPIEITDAAAVIDAGADDLLTPTSTVYNEVDTPTSTVYNLTEELEKSLVLPADLPEPEEKSLDLTSVTQGERHVTAVEDEAAKGDNSYQIKESISCTDGSIDDMNSADDNVKLDVVSEDNSQTKGEEKKDDSLKRIKCEIGKIPITVMRPRSMSGSRYLTDEEILAKVAVLNLDTGESLPLSQAEERLPQAINPLSLHIMRITKEYSSDSSLHKDQHSDDDEQKEGGETTKTLKTVKPVSKKRVKLKRLLGKTVHKIKSVRDGVFHGEESNSDDDELADGRRMIRIKAAHCHKGPYDFDLLVPVQELSGQHTVNRAIWTMKFSPCGRLLATGGQDNLLRVWVLKDTHSLFADMQQKYNEATKVSPAPSQDSLNSQSETVSDSSFIEGGEEEEDVHAPFMRRPLMVYRGHTADLLDISWSKNYFILSSSMDMTVRLWHISRKECLCCFQHIDFVTAIVFHPKDERYFLSGSLDGKLRLWNIPEKKVALWNDVSGSSRLITAANFCLNGRFAVVGTYDGRCIFYSMEQLKYHTQIHVRSTRGKNARGRKITGVECFPGEDKILVTSNDSRIRLYDLRDLTLTCKYKGCANNSSQIKASFSSNGRYIVCGSEDHFVYIWKTQHEFYKFSSARRDRSGYWEGIKAHTAVVTTAIFAPEPRAVIKPQFQYVDSENKDAQPDVRGEVLVSADYSGAIKIFINKFKPGSG